MISKGRTHYTTTWGGLLTILYYALLAQYFFNLLMRMINYDDDLIVVRPYLPSFQNKTIFKETRINLIFNLEY